MRENFNRFAYYFGMNLIFPMLTLFSMNFLVSIIALDNSITIFGHGINEEWIKNAIENSYSHKAAILYGAGIITLGLLSLMISFLNKPIILLGNLDFGKYSIFLIVCIISIILVFIYLNKYAIISWSFLVIILISMSFPFGEVKSKEIQKNELKNNNKNENLKRGTIELFNKFRSDLFSHLMACATLVFFVLQHQPSSSLGISIWIVALIGILLCVIKSIADVFAEKNQ